MLPSDIKVSFTIRPKLLLVSPLAVLAFVAVLHLPWGANSAPAWVQAVGSVLAIVAAIWISNNQLALQVRLVRDREAQLLRLAISLSRHVARVLGTAVEKSQAGDAGLPGIKVLLPVLVEWDGILGGIPIESLPNPESAAAWIEVRQALRGAERGLQSGYAMRAFSPGHKELVARMHGFAQEAVERLVASSSAHLPELQVNVEYR